MNKGTLQSSYPVEKKEVDFSYRHMTLRVPPHLCSKASNRPLDSCSCTSVGHTMEGNTAHILNIHR